MSDFIGIIPYGIYMYNLLAIGITINSSENIGSKS